MNIVTNEFIAKMADTIRTYRARIKINDEIIDGDILSGLNVNFGRCDAQGMAIGAMYVPSCSFAIRDCPISLLNADFDLEIGLLLEDLNEDSVEYIPMGHYAVNSCIKQNNVQNVTAFGSLYSKLGGSYTSALGDTATLNDIKNEIATLTGIPINLGVPAIWQTKQIKRIDGETYRGALQIIAGCVGGYVTERNASEGVEIRQFTTTSQLNVDESLLYEYPQTSEIFTVTGIACDTIDANGAPIRLTSGTPNVVFSNAYMTQQLFDMIASNLIGYEYTPTTIRMLGDLRLQYSDTVQIINADGEELIVPCHLISQTFDGGLITTVTATAQGEAEQQADFSGTLTESISKAVVTAENARSTADGKSTVFYGTSAPTEGMTDGDLWIDTGHDNRMYIYTNNAWTLKRFGYDAIDVVSLFAQSIVANYLTVTGNSQIIGGTIGGFTIDSEKISVETADGKKFVLDSANQSLSFEIKDRTSSQYMELDKNGIEIKAYPSGASLILNPAFFELSDGQGHVVGITPTRMDALDIYVANINGKTPAYADDIPTSFPIKDKFAITTETVSDLSTNASTTISASTLSISKSGYYPLGIVGTYMTGTNLMYINVFNEYLSAQSNGSGTISYRYRNNATSGTFTGTLNFKVLWVSTS